MIKCIAVTKVGVSANVLNVGTFHTHIQLLLHHSSLEFFLTKRHYYCSSRTPTFIWTNPRAYLLILSVLC